MIPFGKILPNLHFRQKVEVIFVPQREKPSRLQMQRTLGNRHQRPQACWVRGVAALTPHLPSWESSLQFVPGGDQIHPKDKDQSRKERGKTVFKWRRPCEKNLRVEGARTRTRTRPEKRSPGPTVQNYRSGPHGAAPRAARVPYPEVFSVTPCLPGASHSAGGKGRSAPSRDIPACHQWPFPGLSRGCRGALLRGQSPLPLVSFDTSL